MGHAYLVSGFKKGIIRQGDLVLLALPLQYKVNICDNVSICFFSHLSIKMLSTLQAQTIIDEIKETFKRRVKEHDWIDDKTTKYVFEKAGLWTLS